MVKYKHSLEGRIARSYAHAHLAYIFYVRFGNDMLYATKWIV